MGQICLGMALQLPYLLCGEHNVAVICRNLYLELGRFLTGAVRKRFGHFLTRAVRIGYTNSGATGGLPASVIRFSNMHPVPYLGELFCAAHKGHRPPAGGDVTFALSMPAQAKACGSDTLVRKANPTLVLRIYTGKQVYPCHPVTFRK